MRTNFTPPNQTSNSKIRLSFIDDVKGLCIILVALSHFEMIDNTISPYLTTGYVSSFFLCAGVTYNYKNNSYISEIVDKAKRLLIPYFFYGLIFTILSLDYTKILGVLYSRYSFQILSSNKVVETLMPSFSSPLWFLTALFASYCLFLLYVRIKKKKHKLLFISILIIASYLCTFLPVLLPWSLDVAPIGALLLVIGYDWKVFFKNLKFSAWLMIPILCAYVFLVHLNGPVNMSVREYGFHSFSFLIFIIGSCLYFLFLMKIFKIIETNVITKFLAITGTVSLQILCLHMFVMSLVIKILSFLPLHVMNVYIALICTIIFCLFMHKALHKIEAKYPLVKYL